MLIHLTLPVRELATAIRFYDDVLAVLGARRVDSSAHAAGYAENAQPFLWLVPNQARTGAVSTRMALRANSNEQVAKFHAAAMTAGGVSIAAPAPVPQHGAHAFGCTVHDPDGHRIELIATAPAQRAENADRPLNDWPDGEAPDYPDSNWTA